MSLLNERLLDTKEIANLLKISASSLEKGRCYANTTFPPYIKIGNAVRYRLSDVEQWLEHSLIKPEGMI